MKYVTGSRYTYKLQGHNLAQVEEFFQRIPWKGFAFNQLFNSIHQLRPGHKWVILLTAACVLDIYVARRSNLLYFLNPHYLDQKHRSRKSNDSSKTKKNQNGKQKHRVGRTFIQIMKVRLFSPNIVKNLLAE